MLPGVRVRTCVRNAVSRATHIVCNSTTTFQILPTSHFQAFTCAFNNLASERKSWKGIQGL